LKFDHSARHPPDHLSGFVWRDTPTLGFHFVSLPLSGFFPLLGVAQTSSIPSASLRLLTSFFQILPSRHDPDHPLVFFFRSTLSPNPSDPRPLLPAAPPASTISVTVPRLPPCLFSLVQFFLSADPGPPIYFLPAMLPPKRLLVMTLLPQPPSFTNLKPQSPRT